MSTEEEIMEDVKKLIERLQKTVPADPMRGATAIEAHPLLISQLWEKFNPNNLLHHVAFGSINLISNTKLPEGVAWFKNSKGEIVGWFDATGVHWHPVPLPGDKKET